MKPTRPKGIDPEQIVDNLYDIALDPQSLDTFIDAWNDAGLDRRAARQTLEQIDQFDAEYQAHLKRADTFLQRDADVDSGPDLSATLTPFANLAAFIVNEKHQVVACNEGAQQSFGIIDGADLGAAGLSPDMRAALDESLQNVFAIEDQPTRLLRLELAGARGTALFQIRRLTHATNGAAPLALIVTTHYHWQPALGQTLEDVFSLTGAEQGVVRGLVEGLDARSIAAERGTSEGTVRGQIKSILAKMNARTQSEVIRFVLSLRDVSQGVGHTPSVLASISVVTSADWLHAEVWKPLKTLTLPDGRRLDYHDMGPATGAPVLLSHMGYGLVRWSEPMLKLAFKSGLRIICHMRAGYGQSTNIDPKADALAAARDDMRFLLNHLKIKRLPYVSQGNDLLFAADLASRHPQIVSEIIGLCARPWIPGDMHYAEMGKWHRFFLSTAKHAPHLLKFTSKAAISMAKRIGPIEMYRQINRDSPADLALIEDPQVLPVLLANAELIVGKTTNMAQAYTMELLLSEAPWVHLLIATKDIKTSFINGLEDPAMNVATIAEYREHYPWIEIEVIQNAGQLLLYQHYDTLIPKLAAAAKRA